MSDRLPDLVSDGELVLRLWEPDDVGMLHEAVLYNLEHLRPFMAWISLEPLTLPQRAVLVDGWRADWERGAHAPMAMLCGGELVGGTGYVRRHGAAALEIGYWVHVDHLGKGYATRATGLLTSAAFEAGVVDAIEVHHDKANLRSAKVPPRLGFTFLGEHPDERKAPAEVGIDCGWRMTAAQWAARPPDLR